MEVNIFGTLRRLNCEKTVGSIFGSIPVLFSKVLLVLEETERCLKTVVGAKITEISQKVQWGAERTGLDAGWGYPISRSWVLAWWCRAARGDREVMGILLALKTDSGAGLI